MNVINTALPDVKIIEPRVYTDTRGFFFESFNQKAFNQAIGHSVCFVQDNHSYSVKHVLRGLHYQRAPRAQAKLVRCISGTIQDVVVDIRPHSATFGQWISVILSAENHRQLWVPEGFAHGFLTLSDQAELLYKTSDYWSPEHERTLLWNDATLNIGWKIQTPPSLSDKDQQGIRFADSLSSS